MGHSQPPTPAATEIQGQKTLAMKQQKKLREIEMRFYWVRDRIRQKRGGKEKPGGLCHKTPPNLAPQNNETNMFRSNKKRHGKFKRPANWNWRKVFWNYQSQGNSETGYSS